MRGRSTLTLGRIVVRMAKLSPPRHRDLVRGMVAELESIADSAERTRFALGAIAAIARLALSGYTRTTVHALGRFIGVGEPEAGAHLGGPTMSKLTTGKLLRRHATAFAVAFTPLTLLLLANDALRRVPQLNSTGASAGTIAEVLLLSIPHIVALTIPMAVFLAVSWVFTRLGAEGVLASAKRERHGLRRLVAPVLGAAAVVALLTFVSNTQVLPHTNARLAALLEEANGVAPAVEGAPRRQSDRTMTIGELREAARTASATGEAGAARAAAYQVEIQKKFALAAACVVLALAGAATAIRFPRGGLRLVLGASAVVFTGYYLSLIAGESLADRLVISPWVAMWMANAILVAVVLLLIARPRRHGPTSGADTLAIGG
ncbi:MAG: LptF/LptG family permease [Gemmatimonadota bacterium]